MIWLRRFRSDNVREKRERAGVKEVNATRLLVTMFRDKYFSYSPKVTSKCP